MRDDFTRSLALAVIVLLGLLALDRLPAWMRRTTNGRRVDRIVREMHNGDLNAEDLHVLAAGYYEGLRGDVPVAGVSEKDDVRSRDDFLRYELKPDVKRRYAAGMRVTNSLGMQNPEYLYAKPPRTRRIALLGDSVALGPYGHDYEALLEDRLNRDFPTPAIQRFQILNFAVYGYSVVQMMDVALEKASKFQPDVYMVAMTDLEVMKGAGWRTHIARLVRSGTDLKYDFLRKIVTQAGVKSSDSLSTIEVKLTPFFIPVLHWALEQIRDHAASEHAQMIAVLVPIPVNPDFIAADFDSLRPAFDNLGVPVIDLRDSFRSSANLHDLEVDAAAHDVHPNELGHQLIFEALYIGLRAQPKAWAILSGNGAEGAH